MLQKIKKGFQIFSLTWEIFNKKQKIVFIFVFLSILFGALLETIGVSALIPFVQAILSPEKLKQNEYIIKLSGIFHITSSTSLVIFISGAVVVFYILKNIYAVLVNYWQNKYRTSVQKHVSVSMLKKYMNRPYSFFVNNNSSVLLRDIIDDANGMMTILCNIFIIMTDSFVALLITAFLFITDPFIALWLSVAVVIVLSVPTLLLGSSIRKAGNKLRDDDVLCRKNAFQAVNGIKEIIVSNKQNFFSDVYESSYIKKTKSDIKSATLSNIPSRMIEAVCISALVITVTAKVVLGNVSDILVANLSAFAIAAFKLLPSVSRISSGFNTLIASYPIITSVHSNINEKNDIKLEEISKKEIDFKNCITFNHVSFHYENSDRLIFENVDLIINKGDVVGIVGPSGAGKTTFVDVLLGLLTQTSGEIRIDETNLDKTNIESWRSKISYVPQTAYLLDDTIQANVAFGIDDKDVNQQAVDKAVKEAMLDSYVSSLENKEKTVVGERGIAMSGGQRQRLSIARALYTNPEIIVFDEATSALDEITEKEIMESIDNLIGSKTLIIIAHRLSTLKKCNKIFEVKDGKITQKESL